MDTAIGRLEILASEITPGLKIKDPVAAYWFSQVNLRLRREVSWCWYQRMQQPEKEGMLPPVTDAALENLDLVRYASQKQLFFQQDQTAKFLSQEIHALAAPAMPESPWCRAADRLNLNPAAQFVLALGFAMQLDASLAPIFATCLNDWSRPFPTLALGQRLWDEPVEIMSCADPNHALFRYGLLGNIYDGADGQFWQKPLNMPSIVAQQFIDPDHALPAGAAVRVRDHERPLDPDAQLLIARLRPSPTRMQIVPLLGPKGVAYADWASTLSARINRPLVSAPGYLLQEQHQILALACVCWMKDMDIVLPDRWVKVEHCKERGALLDAARELPLRWYLPLDDGTLQHHFPEELLVPPFMIKGLDFEERTRAFKHYLGSQARQMDKAIEECARRFRFQEALIARVARTFDDKTVALNAKNLESACAHEAAVEMDNLAQLVSPRFGIDELVLPKNQTAQFKDILHAMQALTVVHYHWGTARTWNEGGLSVLFCGPPGTGKTMSAEVLANELHLPMFRIDLSQVVNKYIGETEKNLKRIFDAAELNDCILFFDEADALFGKRTDVKDAHDRFANIEISYLLERMERFKGLAILATNRRKDLDDAFMRRLRYVVEFEVPDFDERMRIWQQVFPSAVDIHELDIRFLAKQFQLSGGHIRSVAFNACLRAADPNNPQAPKRISMRDVMLAIKRELEKMKRSASDELFGPYAHLLKACI